MNQSSKTPLGLADMVGCINKASQETATYVGHYLSVFKHAPMEEGVTDFLSYSFVKHLVRVVVTSPKNLAEM